MAYTVGQTSQTVYLRADFTKIGKNEAGAMMGFAGMSMASNAGSSQVVGMHNMADNEKSKETQANGWTYQDTAAYGHFGRGHFPWEKTDKIEILQQVAEKYK